MLLYANAAYWDNPSSQILPPNFSVVHTFNYTLGTWDRAFAFMGVDMSTRRVILAFRGSDTLTQITLELIHHALVPLPSAAAGVMVNKFFLRAIDALMKKFTKALIDLQSSCKGCELFITGHSLGGAMSILAAHHIQRDLAIGTPTVYTFGSPRVGNAPFAQHLEERVPRLFRLVNAADLVPHIPACTYNKSAVGEPCEAGENAYYHAGIELWFPYGDYKRGVMCGYRECTGTPRSEDTSCSNGLFSIGYPPSRWDHRKYFDVIPSGFCGTSTQSVIMV